MADDKDEQGPKKPRSSTPKPVDSGQTHGRASANTTPEGDSKPQARRVTKSDAKKKIDKIDKDFVAAGAAKMTDDDFKRVSDKADEIKKKFEKGGPLGRYINDVKLLISVVQDYIKGRYREIPYLSIGAIVFALLYVLSPIDLIPDFIPVVGYLDDAAVVALCLMLVEQDLHEYKEWKVKQAAES